MREETKDHLYSEKHQNPLLRPRSLTPPSPLFRLHLQRGGARGPRFDCPCGATLTCSFKMMCSSRFRLRRSFVPLRDPRGPGRRSGPRPARGAPGALKPATHKQVKRQLSVIVNVDTQLHNGKINGAIGDINLNSTRPFLLVSPLLSE